MRALRLLALIADSDADAFVEKSFFPQTLGKLVEAEFGRIEYLRVGLESNLRAALSSLSSLFQLHNRNSALILLLVSFAVAPDFQAQSFGKEVDAGDAHAVQPARNLVSVGIELAASV